MNSKSISGTKWNGFSGAPRRFLVIIILLASLVGIVYTPFAHAAPGVPRIMNVQGRLMDSNGVLLGGSGTEYCFQFSFYDTATAGSGTKLWPSGSPSPMTVNVRNGIYNAGIGNTNAGGDVLDFNFQDTDLAYLNVEVASKVGATCAPGDGAEVFETLSPRQRIFAAGYAVNASMLSGFSAAQHASGNDVPVLSSGNLILGGTNPMLSATTTNTLTLQGASTGDIRFFGASNFITSAGNATFAGSLTSLGVSTTHATATNFIVSGGFTLGSMTGVLKAVAGTVSAALLDLANDVTGILGIENGGTGTSTLPTYGQVLVGNAVGGYDLVATSSLGIQSTGSGDVGSGILGQFPFYEGSGTALTATSSLFLDTMGRIGVGSTTPWGRLSVNSSGILGPAFVVGSSASTLFAVDDTGVSIGDESGGGDANFQFASDPNAWSMGYFEGDKSFRIASSTNLATNVFFSLAKTGEATLGVGLALPALANCTQALETDASGNIICGTDVAGGGGGAGAWATTTDDLAIYVADPSDVVIIGGTATTTTGMALEIAGNALTRGEAVVYGGVTAPRFVSTSSIASILPYASTTAISAQSASTSNLIISNSFTFGNATGILKAVAGVVSSALVDLANDVTGILGIENGGTGTSTAPAYGQVLVGNAAGGYDLVATSSLGIQGGGGGVWGSITGTLADQTDLQNALDGKLSLSAWYATTSDALDEGQSNLYFTSQRATDNFISNLAATTSVASITTLSSLSITQSQISDLDLYTEAEVNAFIAASTTIPKTYTSNTFAALQTFGSASTTNLSSVYASSTRAFFGSLSLGSLTGVLKATAGTVTAAMLDLENEVTGVLAIAHGGTGTSTAPTYGQLLIGNAAGGYDLLATSTLGVALQDTTGTLGETRGGTGQTTYTKGDILFASDDGVLSRLGVGVQGTVLKVSAGGVPFWGTDLTSGGGGGAGAWATTTNNLAIYPTDTSKVVLVGTNATTTSTSIFEVNGDSYFGGAALIDGALNVNGQTTLGNASTSNISSTYASSTRGFFGELSIGNLSGILKATAGVVSASLLDLANDVTGILGIENGGTGTSTAPAYGQVLVGNAAGGYDLVATSSLGIQGGGGGVWGSITGTLADQTDLQNALDGKLSLSAWYATTTDGLDEGNSNFYFTTNRFASALAGTTTDALPQGVLNRYYSDSLVNTFLGASTTLPKTYAANTFTNSNTFSGSLLFSGSTLASDLYASSFGSSVFGVGTVATTTLQGNTTGTSTIQGFLNVLGTNSTSTFSGGLAASRLNLTATNATSTFASGVNLTDGCYAINGVCIGAGGGVSTVSNADGTLTVSPTSGNVVVSLNLANANVWSGLQRFAYASTTAASALDTISVGRTATTTIRGEANATSTFAGGVDANRINTTATSTLAGVRLTNITNCAEALETDAAGNVVCGNDAGVDGVTVTTFTNDGNWTKSNYPNLTFTQVIVTGGGGGGGGADANDATSETAGGGGGAGGTTIEMLSASSLGTTESVTIGTAGSGGGIGANGTAGGTSSFGSTLTSATGGNFGAGAITINVCDVSGAGGAQSATTTNGDLSVPGGGGSGGTCAAEVANGGNGGASYWGGGARGGSINAAGVENGGDARAYGAGGGGGAAVDNAAGATGGAGSAGVVVTMNYTSSGADLAEWYETKEDVEAGDVVAISADSYEYDSKLGLQKSSILEKATPRSSVVGVVSTAPYETMGYDIFSKALHPHPIALAGRVPVKASLENGEIKAGDLLTISSSPGIAMRSTKAGVTIGRALEDAVCDEGGSCTVLIMVQTTYSTGAILNVAFRDLGMDTNSISTELDFSKMILAEMMQQKKNITATSTLSEMLTDRLAAGLEIITPRVVTDTIVASVIQPLEKDIRIQLAEGKFIIERALQASTTISFDTASSTASTTPLLSIDALGNAVFVGAITGADLIVGTREKPGGITMYDTDTGEPYCARIVYGRLETFAGTCAELVDLFEATKPEEESVSELPAPIEETLPIDEAVSEGIIDEAATEMVETDSVSEGEEETIGVEDSSTASTETATEDESTPTVETEVPVAAEPEQTTESTPEEVSVDTPAPEL